MGGAQSTPRKLSIPNDDSHFIKVSESVAERLRRCTEKSPEDFYSKQGKEDCPSSEAQKYVRNLENLPPSERGLPGDPLINYYYGPSVTSIRVLQEKEKELKDSEDYWSTRIQKMEQHHSKLSKIMEDEYNKAIMEISCQVPRPPPNMPFPCSEEKDRVLQCYKKNPKEILLCAGEITQFADCVHAKRINAQPAREHVVTC